MVNPQVGRSTKLTRKPASNVVTLTDERKALADKIRWLLLLRVIIVSFFLGAAALFHFLRTEGELRYLLDLSIPLIIAYVVSIGSVAVLSRIPNLRPFAHAQVGFDVLLITGIIWITGDIASPFSFLYNMAVMNGAMLLFYRGAFFTAACSSLSYAGLILWSRYAQSRGWAAAFLADAIFHWSEHCELFCDRRAERVPDQQTRQYGKIAEREARRLSRPGRLKRSAFARHRQRRGDHRSGRAHQLFQPPGASSDESR